MPVRIRIPEHVSRAGLSWLLTHPRFVVDATRNAAQFGATIPVDLLRWLTTLIPKGKGPERLAVSAAPPGLRVDATINVFGTRIEVGSDVTVEAVTISPDAARVEIRVSKLSVVAPPDSPAAMMIQAIDLTNPGALANMMPNRPAFLVEAAGDRFVFDLLKVPRIAGNRVVRRALAALSGVVGVKSIRAAADAVVVSFAFDPRALPGALSRAFAA
ncbi:MAG: hypothetical protein HYY84_08110 [Deltaproteobacteria bacterium]|nr:hypothetical protein [Deltaproteobacteria bacterium]